MTILNGKELSLEMREELKMRAGGYASRVGHPPCLAVVLVGEDPASHVYVKNKIKACEAVGIESRELKLPESVTQEELLQHVAELNADDKVNGILVQLPLPKSIDADAVVESIDPLKDADGLTAENMGLLFCGKKRVAPCTPHGVIKILEKYNIPLSGAEAVVVGRSQIVGKPMAQLLLEKSATVTVCHSKTKNLREHLQKAEIVVVAVGQPLFLGKEDFKPGAIIVDVGIHRKADGKLCGDVRFDEASEIAHAITPVPGGVGPMTIAMLLENTVTLAELQEKQSEEEEQSSTSGGEE